MTKFVLIMFLCSAVPGNECQLIATPINDFKTYLSLCSNNKIKEATKFIISICNNGYSVIDILEEFFSFIKNHSNLEDKYKYQIVKIICSYIHIFNNIHEDQIELIFLTNNIIKILGKSV